jgi:O-antigen/teichoic acid export membrane protein
MIETKSISRAASVLASGRAPGLIIAFAIPLVLARTFDQTEFGTYKQLVRIYSTLFGLAQLGMAESLYYFVPRDGSQAGRYVANALVALASIGLAAVAVLALTRDRLADWLTNPALSTHAVLLGWFLAFMLVTAVLEIVLISRKQHGRAAWAFAASDIARAICLTVPALFAWGLRGVMAGAVTFAAVRLVVTLITVWREYRSELRVDVPALRRQLAYALPFALAVGIEILHINWHQYAVASRFDAAAFAIYAVGCLQVPVVDLIVTSTVNVMMVEMAAVQGRDNGAALWLWHDTIGRLAFMIFPLAAFLVLMAHEIIVVLFTTAYEASVPIFMLWSLTMLASVLVVDGVLRVFAQTRYLVVQNILHLAIVAGLAGVFIRSFGLQGAVLVTLLATLTVRSVAIVRISRLMGVGLADALPWRRLATAAACAAVAALPAWLIVKGAELHPIVALLLAAPTYALAYAALYYAVGRHSHPPLLSSAATTI